MAVGNKFAESQGLSYVPNDAYLQENFKGSAPLDFSNVSSSGIMSQAPIPGPLQYIRQGGEGDGDGGPPSAPPGNPSFDYETEAYGLNNMTPEEKGITEEEQKGLDSIKNAKIGKMGLAKTLGAFFMGGPFAGIFQAYRQNKKAKQDAIDIEKAAQTQRDFDGAMAQGDSFYDGLNEGRGASVSKESRENAGAGFNDMTPGNPFAKGGRVGYFFGGRVNYKAGGRVSFKNGGLASIL